MTDDTVQAGVKLARKRTFVVRNDVCGLSDDIGDGVRTDIRV